MGELEIPVLDLGPLLIGGSTEAEAERLLDGLAAQLASACGRVGFLKLTGCDAVVPPALVDEVFAVTERFHDLDLEAKLALGLDAPTMRGYLPNDVDVMRDETYGNARNLNVKGSWNAAFSVTSGAGTRMSFASNPWPDESLPEMRTTLARYDSAMTRLKNHLLPVYARALGLSAAELSETFAAHGKQQYRLSHYPETPTSTAGEAISAAAEEPLTGIGAHADGSFITILAHRDPGLSMYHRETQSWIPVPPSLPGGFLVNTGELLYRLTNGQWRNTVHRVEPQPFGHARHAVVTFVDLHDDVEFDTVFLRPGETPRWGLTVRVADVTADILADGFETTLRELREAGSRL